MKPSPYLHINRIEIVITEQCNGQCLHCSAAKPNGKLGRAHIDAAKTAGAIETLCKHFSIQSVMTFGGEPLLYPAVTCAVHHAAAKCKIPQRQLITNGCFSNCSTVLENTANALRASGVNTLLLSVDAFHQKTLPLKNVHDFAQCAKNAGIEHICLHPAWLVDRSNSNIWNQQTKRLLQAFSDLGIQIGEGNDIFLAGRAKKNLQAYYPKQTPRFHTTCGAQPYTQPLDRMQTLSLTPNGDIMACAFVIGNFYQEDIEKILASYNPYADPYMYALLSGGAAALAKTAKQNGIIVDTKAIQSTCELCRAINQKRAQKNSI